MVFSQKLANWHYTGLVVANVSIEAKQYSKNFNCWTNWRTTSGLLNHCFGACVCLMFVEFALNTLYVAVPCFLIFFLPWFYDQLAAIFALVLLLTLTQYVGVAFNSESWNASNIMAGIIISKIIKQWLQTTFFQYRFHYQCKLVFSSVIDWLQSKTWHFST